MYALIGIWIAAGLLALGILAIVVSGIRGAIIGRQEFKKIGIILIPFIAYAVAYLVTYDFAQAGILTMLFMMAMMALAILFTGTRSTFNL